jgi:hypothetical protein
MQLTGNESVVAASAQSFILRQDWPHRRRKAYSDKYPNPAKPKLLCPLGKLLHASCRICSFACVQTEYVRSLCSGVPRSGWHRSIRSGRGRPTAFLIMSVMKGVRMRETVKPRIVTWNLWVPGRASSPHRARKINGIKAEYIIDHTGQQRHCSARPFAPTPRPQEDSTYTGAPSPP